MKVKVLKSFYDPETEKRGRAGEEVEISQAVYRRYGKAVFKAKSFVEGIKHETVTSMKEPVKKKAKRKK